MSAFKYSRKSNDKAVSMREAKEIFSKKSIVVTIAGYEFENSTNIIAENINLDVVSVTGEPTLAEMIETSLTAIADSMVIPADNIESVLIEFVDKGE